MKFALVFQYDPAQASPAEGEIQDWLDLDKEVHDAGVSVYGDGFHAADAGRTVSLRDDSTTVINGIDRTGELVAGLYVVDVADIEAATAWAKKIPTARYGSVDVRPVVEFDG